MPIIVTDDQGQMQEICPAACYDGLFDPNNMTQEQIDAICNLFSCGPMDVGALATALYLICEQNSGEGTDTFGTVTQAIVAGVDTSESNYDVGDFIVLFPDGTTIHLEGLQGLDTSGTILQATVDGTDTAGNAYVVGDYLLVFPDGTVVSITDLLDKNTSKTYLACSDSGIVWTATR